MTPARARAMYRRTIRRVGETVTFERVSSPGLAVQNSATVSARCIGFTEEEVTEGRGQGRRHIIVMHDDLVAQSFPVPLTDEDRVTVRGRTQQIAAVDGNTRRTQGVCIAYDVFVEGPAS